MGSTAEQESKLTAQQQRAILALLSTKSVSEAAKQAKVGGRTLWRWLSDPVFRVHLAAAEADMLDAATRQLLQMQEGALATVQAIMQDAEAGAGVRLRAAQAVLDYLLKLRELRNVEQRLTALEMAHEQEQRATAGRA